MTKKTNSGARFQNNSYQTDPKGDMDEEEDLCAVPPHIMRIMQVQKYEENLNVDMLLIITTAVTLVMTKVMRKVMMTKKILKSDADFFQKIIITV